MEHPPEQCPYVYLVLKSKNKSKVNPTGFSQTLCARCGGAWLLGILCARHGVAFRGDNHAKFQQDCWREKTLYSDKGGAHMCELVHS